MRLLAVMDPADQVKRETATTFGLMLAAQERGHAVAHCLAADVGLAGGAVCVAARHAVMNPRTGAPIELGAVAEEPIAAYDAVLIRPDPPFDTTYLTLTLLLERARGSTLMINDPRGLREANEKLYGCQFPDVMPPTIVTADAARIVEFVARHDGAVLKPIDGHAGRGVLKLAPGDPNTGSIIEQATAHGTRHVMVQTYLPAVRDGDKRILLLDGEPLGAVLRVPAPDDFRANLAVGGTAARAGIDAADRRIIDRLAPALRRDGLWFVGIDVIGGLLTEVNVTSPTGLRQLPAEHGADPAHDVIEWIEWRLAAPHRAHVVPERSTP